MKIKFYGNTIELKNKTPHKEELVNWDGDIAMCRYYKIFGKDVETYHYVTYISDKAVYNKNLAFHIEVYDF